MAFIEFKYTRPEETKVEAYGKVFQVPPKTSVLLEDLNSINVRIGENANNPLAQMEAIWDGIARFIGKENTEEIFPRAELKNHNTDEMTAFWFILNRASNAETEIVLEKYNPKSTIKVTSNPKK